MSELGIGVIGAGGMGSEHARNLAALDGVHISVVADAVEASAMALAGSVGADATTDAVALINDPRVDAVVIASTDETHEDLALAALHSNKPTLCEKPLATTLQGAVSVMESESVGGRRLLQIGLMREYDPVHQQLREQVMSNGGVRHIRAVHRNRNEFERTTDHAISQSMVHDIHTAHWLSESEIIEVLARSVPRGNNGVRFVTANARLQSGSLATFEFDDFAFGYDVSVEASCIDGLARTPAPTDPRLHDDWFAWFSEAYRLEVRDWVESIRSGIPTGPSAWDGVAAQAVVEAIQKSVRTGMSEIVALPAKPQMYG